MGVMVPFGAAYNIGLPTKGPTRLFSHPSYDVFLSVSPDMVCLWNSSPVHLLSYHIRTEPFVEETGGGYTDVAAWDDRRIELVLGNGTVDTYMLNECPAQFPLDEAKRGLTYFLTFESHQRPETNTKYLNGTLRVASVQEEDETVLCLTEYNHTGEWIKFDPPIKVPNTSVAFNATRQLLAVISEGQLEVYTIKPDSEELAWSVEAAPGASVAITDCGVILLSGGKICFYSHVGELLAERPIPPSFLPTYLLALGGELVLGTTDGLQVVPLAVSERLSLDFLTADHQALLFRRDLHLPHTLKWEHLDVPRKYSKIKTSPDGKWACGFGGSGVGLYKRATGKWRHAEQLPCTEVAWLPQSGLMLVLTSYGSGAMVRVMNPEQDLSACLHDIELMAKPVIHFSASSTTDFLIVMFEDMSVHLYRVTLSSGGAQKVSVEFALNLSLGSERCLMSNWQVDLFTRSSLSSPSEVDLRDLEPKPVQLENLIFLQGDTLFTVLLRASTISDTTTSATMIERGGVDRFFLKAVGDDLWMGTVHRSGVVKMRRWPFGAEPDFTTQLSFPLIGFYPDLSDGVFIGLSSGTNLGVSDTRLLAPSLLVFYLEQDELSPVKLLFSRSTDQGLLLEYLLLELVNKSNRLKAAQTIAKLHHTLPPAVGRSLYRSALVRISRKIDVSDAKWLFACTSPVETLFGECLEENDLENASSLLMLRLVLDASPLSGEDTEEKSREPILWLLNLALEAEAYGIVGDVMSFVGTLWPAPSDLIDGPIRGHAGVLVQSHRWTAFVALSRAWDPADPAALFDTCFGKLPQSVVDEASIEARVCAVYAQLDRAPPTIEDVRRRSQANTPILRTASSIPVQRSGSSFHPGSISLASLSLSTEKPETEADAVIAFLDALDGLRQESLLWRIVLYADPEAIEQVKAEDPEFAQVLRVFMAAQPALAWIAARFV